MKTSRQSFLLALVAAAGTIAGCTVGPDYTEPEAPAAKAETWSEPLEGGVTAAPADLSRWWTMLHDPVLDSLIDRAVAGNHDVRIAEARLREARAQRGIVASDGLPIVDFGGGYTRSRGSENGTSFQGGSGSIGVAPGTQSSTGTDLYQAGFDASWEIDVFGRVKRNIEAADADIAVAEMGRRDTLVSLLAEVCRNYVEARSFQARLLIAQENIKTQSTSVEIAKARVAAGLSSDLDTSRAEAQLATTQSQVPVLEAGYKQAAHRLAVLLGQEPGSLLGEMDASAAIPPTPPEVPVGLPSDLLRRRPDIRRAERTLAAATARVGAATADLYPTFTIVGSAGLSSIDFGDLPDMNSRFWSIGPTIRWPVLDWGRIRSNIKVQDARVDAALAEYEKSILTAFEDVDNALVRYSREQIRRKSLAEAVAANKRAVELSNELWTRGLTDFLSVIDAQRSLYVTQDELVQSERNVTANLIALYKALGGGWETFEAKQQEAGAGDAKPVEPTDSTSPVEKVSLR